MFENFIMNGPRRHGKRARFPGQFRQPERPVDAIFTQFGRFGHEKPAGKSFRSSPLKSRGKLPTGRILQQQCYLAVSQAPVARNCRRVLASSDMAIRLDSPRMIKPLACMRVSHPPKSADVGQSGVKSTNVPRQYAGPTSALAASQGRS
jgi:hypothetical protein